MGKPIEKDGKFYRIRRGKLVEIPPEWLGKVTSRQTINARPSKSIHKHRKALKYGARELKRSRVLRKVEEKMIRDSEAQNDKLGDPDNDPDGFQFTINRIAQGLSRAKRDFVIPDDLADRLVSYFSEKWYVRSERCKITQTSSESLTYLRFDGLRSAYSKEVEQ